VYVKEVILGILKLDFLVGEVLKNNLLKRVMQLFGVQS
jgi:hypothetical protein